jgi:hypothetical protein
LIILIILGEEHKYPLTVWNQLKKIGWRQIIESLLRCRWTEMNGLITVAEGAACVRTSDLLSWVFPNCCLWAFKLTSGIFYVLHAIVYR